MSKEINDADFVNLANGLVGAGLIYTGNKNFALAQEYAKQEIYGLLAWVLTPNDDYTISSGEGCFYFNGQEKSFPQIYELYLKSKQP